MSLLDQFFILWTEEPALVWFFLASLLVAAFYFVFGAKVRITHKQAQQNRQVAFTVAQGELRERAAHLRLVSGRMTDDNEAA